MKYITPEIAKEIFDAGVINGSVDTQKATIFYLKSVLEHRLDLLKQHFPNNTLHAVAIKTNNHPDVLKHIVNSGFGLEAASMEEVMLARTAGASNEHIVFDSPVKTPQEIDSIVTSFTGMYVNANSLEELDRYPDNHGLNLGLRINPLVQSDATEIFDVATSTSKFGVPISREEEIVKACIKHQITVLHFHIGSGIKDFSANLRAAKKVIELAQRIDAIRELKGDETRINTLDIGGGIYFDLDNDSHSVQEFCESLSQIDGIQNYRLITEYGAFIHKHNSFVVSKVEYVIDNGKDVPKLAYVHVGADLFLRKVYSSLNIEYPYSVFQDNESNEMEEYTVVGPLCFSGDVLYEGIKLPKLSAGDYLVMLSLIHI